MIIWAIHESITDTILGSNSNIVKCKNNVAPDLCNIAFSSLAIDTVHADPSTEDVLFFHRTKRVQISFVFLFLADIRMPDSPILKAIQRQRSLVAFQHRRFLKNKQK